MNTYIPVPYEPEDHDPDVENGNGEKDDSHNDAVGDDEGVGVGQVVQHRRLGQHPAPVLTLQKILEDRKQLVKGTISHLLVHYLGVGSTLSLSSPSRKSSKTNKIC